MHDLPNREPTHKGARLVWAVSDMVACLNNKLDNGVDELPQYVRFVLVGSTESREPAVLARITGRLRCSSFEFTQQSDVYGI